MNEAKGKDSLKKSVVERFQTIFIEYVSFPDEVFLARAADIGRELVHSGVPPENIGDFFEAALKGFIRKFPDTRLSEVSDAIPMPLMELLMAYGMAFRQQQEQKRIYEKNRLTSMIMEKSLDGIWMSDSEAVIQIVNPSLCRITGYRPEEITGKNLFVLYGIAADDVVMAKVWEIINREGFWKGEIASRRKDGEIYPALLSISTIRDESGRIQNYIGFLNDISEKHRNESIKQELDRAREIYNLIAQPQLPEIEGVRINMKCIPADNIGGDIMEILKVNEKKLVIFLADITGHGVSAAMTANTLKMLFREVSADTVSPENIFRYINNVMYRNILPDDMIAAFCGSLDLESMTLDYCLNGIPSPLIVRGGEVVRLEPTGLPLGVFRELPFDGKTIPVLNGDLLLIFTDGLTESRNESGEVYGISGIENSLKAKGCDVHTAIDEILGGVFDFQHSTIFSDDVFLLAVSIFDENSAKSVIPHSNTYSFPTKSVCKGKTRFFFIDEVVEFFLGYVSQITGNDLCDLGRLKIAMFELILNAIEHGNLEMTIYKHDFDFYDSEAYWRIFNERMNSDNYGNRLINIECVLDEEKLVVTVEDNGNGFDSGSVLPPVTDERLTDPAGRGISLVRMNVDQLIYNMKGNKASIYKYLPLKKSGE